MKLTFDVDNIEIIQKTLVEDLSFIKKDIKRLKTKRKNEKLAKYEVEDLVDYKKYKNAMEVLIGYYFPYEEAEKILGKKID